MEELMFGWNDVEKSSCGNIRRFNSHHNALLLLLPHWWLCWKIFLLGGTNFLGTNHSCMHVCVWSDGVHPSGDIDRTPRRMLEVGPCGLPPWASKPKHRCYVDVPWWEYPRGLQSGTFRCNSNSSLFNRRHLYCYERTKRVPRVQLWDLNPWAYWLQSWDVALKPSATTDSDHIHFYSGLGQRDMLQK